VAALRQDDARAGRDEVGDQISVRYPGLCSDRNLKLDRLTVRAVLASAPPGPTASGLEPRPGTESREVAQVAARDEDDVTAAAAVTAVWPAPRDVLLTAEREPAVATAPGDSVDLRPIVKQVLP